MDKDKSGNLTLQELTGGFNENEEFSNLMQLLDVQEEDTSFVFELLDANGDGVVSYDEFIEQLYKMKTQQVLRQ